jgi:hypothetical protein
MWLVWKKRDVYIGFRWGDLKEDHLEETGVDKG